jgi:hypothetical protein
MRYILRLALCCCCLTSFLSAAAAASPSILRDLALSNCVPPQQPNLPGGPCCGPNNCSISQVCGPNDLCCDPGRGGQAIGQTCNNANNCCIGDCFNQQCCSACPFSYVDAGPTACACALNGKSCNSSSQCCSGVCNLAASQCVSGPSDCCQGPSDCSTGLTCQNAQCCIQDLNAGYAGNCAQDTDCCTGDCDNGICQPQNQACVNKGGGCWDSADCCTENAVADVCTPGQVNPSFCLYGLNHACNVNGDCASGDCDNKVCVPTGPCIASGAMGCDDALDCCSPNSPSNAATCEASGATNVCCFPDLTYLQTPSCIGVSCCSNMACAVTGGSTKDAYCPPAACQKLSSACGSASDCCGGGCNFGTGVLGTCCVKPAGTTCSTAADCCVANSSCTGGKCLSPNGASCSADDECIFNDCDPISTGGKQCIGDSHSGAPGSACGEANDCGSNTCTNFKCVCSNLDGTCTTSGDCCIAGSFCTAGKCSSPSGSACTVNGDCNSGRCNTNIGKCTCAAAATTEAAVKPDEALCCDTCGAPENFFHGVEVTCTCEKAASGKPCYVGTDCQSGLCNTLLNAYTCF